MRRTSKDHDKRWNFDEYLFKSIMLRIGRKKKNVKGYFYRITHFGLLMYFKKVIYLFLFTKLRNLTIIRKGIFN